MKKFQYNIWVFYAIGFLLYYLDYTVDYRGDWEVNQSFLKNFLFVFYFFSIFLFNNHVLIPRLFYRKKYWAYFFILLTILVLASWVEEEILEKWIYPSSRGHDSFHYMKLYFHFADILGPLFAFSCIKVVMDNFRDKAILEQVKQDKLVNELKFLKSQIQPHILFNSLNAIYEFSLSKSPKAPDMILKLSNLLRYILYETDQNYVPLEKEIAIIEDYIALQKIQMEDRGQVSLNIAVEEASYQYLIAPHIIIPFIENAFKHSMHTISTGINIQINIACKENAWRFQIQNTHKNQETSTQLDLLEKGVGIENVKKRLELLYPERYALSVEETDQQYFVNLKLELGQWRS